MKNNFYRLLFSTFLAFGAFFGLKAEIITYKLDMRLKIPRVYNNTESLGYRKVQHQYIRCYLYIDKSLATEKGLEEAIVFCSAENKTHRINGKRVTYDIYPIGGFWHYIGNNRTGVFRQPSIRIDLDCDPSFNIGDDEPDNTLVISLSGTGSSDRRITGTVSGQIGCGCRAYGHISPTRTADLCYVVDIAGISGNFVMKKID